MDETKQSKKEGGSIVLRVLRNRKYSTINLGVLDDTPEISWKAAGIHTYLVSRPDRWKFNREDLIQRHTDGPASVDAGLDELKTAKLLTVKRIRGADGKMTGWEWTVSESPMEAADMGEKPIYGKSDIGEPPTIVNIISLSKNKQKNSDTDVSPPPTQKKTRTLTQRDVILAHAFILEGVDPAALDERGKRRLYAEHGKYLTDLEYTTKAVGADTEAVIESYFTAPDRFPFGPRGERTLRKLRNLDIVKAVVAIGDGGAGDAARRFIRENPTNTIDAAERAMNSGRIDSDLYFAVKRELKT